MKLSNREPQLWIKAILVIGAIYSLVWGLLIVFFPNMLFVASHLDAPNYTFLWQTTGAIEIIFSIGLIIASRHAYKNWTIILLIALAKFLAVIIYFNSAFAHEELFSLSNYIFKQLPVNRGRSDVANCGSNGSVQVYYLIAKRWYHIIIIFYTADCSYIPYIIYTY